MILRNYTAWILISAASINSGYSAAASADDSITGSAAATFMAKPSKEALPACLYSQSELNRVLAAVKPETLTIQNKTGTKQVLDIYYVQYPSFDAEDDGETGYLLLPPDNARYAAVTLRGEEPLVTESFDQMITMPKTSVHEEDSFWIHRSQLIKAEEEKVGIPAVEEAYIGRLYSQLSADIFFNLEEQEGGIVLCLENAPKPPLYLSQKPADFLKLAGAVKSPPPLFAKFRALGLRAEGINPKEGFEKLQALHEGGKDQLARWVFGLATEAESASAAAPSGSLPKTIHTLWLTSSSSPQMPDDITLQRLNNAVLKCDPDLGWSHILWVTDKSLKEVPGLNPRVEVREIGSITSVLSHVALNYVNKGGDYHKASFVMRFAILKALGGIIRGSDVELFHDLSPLAETYNFFAGLDNAMGFFLSTSLVGAKPGHPIIEETIRLILRNLGPSSAKPAYMRELESDPVAFSLLGLSGGMLTVATMKAGVPGKDMVLAPSVLSPKRTKVEIDAVTHKDMKWPLRSLATHFAVREWMKKG